MTYSDGYTDPTQGAAGDGSQQGGQPAAGGAHDDGYSDTGTAPQDQTAVEQEIEKFLKATPPPEPRGSAYVHTTEFQSFATTVALPEHPTTFHEKYFLYLFAGSLSLQLSEKKEIISKVPTLSQFQIDELIKILEEEKQKFDELDAKHPEQVQKLRETAAKEWQLLEMESHKETVKAQDEQDVDAIRKQLGL